MSVYSRQNLVMPKIARSLTMKRRSLDEQKYMTGKELNFVNNRKSMKIPYNIIDNYKKPGTSIEKIKPMNIFPKITSTKILPSTANNLLLEEELANQLNNKININKKLMEEINKDEYFNFHKIETINNIGHININNPKIIINDNDNNEIKEKEKKQNKKEIDINKYKDICVNILSNNADINKMFSEIYKEGSNNAKKWVETNLFGREVFKIRLETYIKNKTDVLSFIKKEIEKIINNEYCDYLFSKSYKEIENQYDEHIKYIENL